MKTMNMKKAQSGFTLIEIAIVLVIVGLLLGGVLQGQQLIENSRVRAAVNDFNGVPAAAFSYMDRYRRFPGDDLFVTSERGGAWTTSGIVVGNASGTLDGATNTTFNPSTETLAFWQHLRAAGFIPGNPGTTGPQALPQNPFGGLTGVNSGAIQGMPAGVNKLCMNNVGGTAALALDGRMDDGDPARGNFRANTGATVNNTAATVYNTDLLYTVCNRM
jgi:prepilin-type N-terminal cleavage/methylation domain-containing protein